MAFIIIWTFSQQTEQPPFLRSERRLKFAKPNSCTFSVFGKNMDGWMDAPKKVKGCVFGGLLIFFRLNIRSKWAVKLTFWKLERGQRLCWCDSGLWGWSAGGSSQGDLGWEGTLLLIISQSSSHQCHCWEAGKIQQLGVDGQAGRAKDGGNLVPIRLLGCWSWTVGLLSSWNWTIKCFSL